VPKKTKAPTKDTEQVAAAFPSDAPGPAEKPSRRPLPKAKKAATKKGAKRSKTKAAATPLPTEEEIRIRAYFISERRHRFALPGDATSDWEEARRQLLSEAGPR
jgi:hypothetical protein